MKTGIENISRKKLLIVDDSVEIREGLKRFVSELDSIELVGESGDGIGAMEMIEELKPDFVTLDIMMPGMNGLMTLTEIKKKYPSIIVFMLTNFPFEKYKKVCSSSGADYFFDKSNEFEEMIDLLKSLTTDSIKN